MRAVKPCLIIACVHRTVHMHMSVTLPTARKQSIRMHCTNNVSAKCMRQMINEIRINEKHITTQLCSLTCAYVCASETREVSVNKCTPPLAQRRQFAFPQINVHQTEIV